jgi:hypothetical protein
MFKQMQNSVNHLLAHACAARRVQTTKLTPGNRIFSPAPPFRAVRATHCEGSEQRNFVSVVFLPDRRAAPDPSLASAGGAAPPHGHTAVCGRVNHSTKQHRFVGISAPSGAQHCRAGSDATTRGALRESRAPLGPHSGCKASRGSCGAVGEWLGSWILQAH